MKERATEHHETSWQDIHALWHKYVGVLWKPKPDREFRRGACAWEVPVGLAEEAAAGQTRLHPNDPSNFKRIWRRAVPSSLGTFAPVLMLQPRRGTRTNKMTIEFGD